MNLDDFMDLIRKGQIPPEAPDGLTINGHGFNVLDSRIEYWTTRDDCAQYGMWAIVTRDWTKELAEWISNRKCLEIMAGKGWLAKALNFHGVEVIATDNNTWDDKHTKMIVPVYPILKHEASSAIEHFGSDCDILIVSWPPYGENDICDAVELWGPDRPIVYIGEGCDGCNASEQFWRHFKEDDDAPNIPLMSWHGLHDHIFVGYYHVD